MARNTKRRAKAHFCSFSVTPSLKAAAVKAALDEKRTIRSLVEMLLTEHLLGREFKPVLVQLRLAPSIKQAADVAASSEGQTLENLIIQLLKNHVERGQS